MAKYIDLTLTLEDGMRGVSTEVARDIKKDGWNATTFHLYSHCGTHMDAPLHFGVNDSTIDEIPVSRFFVDCWIVDVRDIGDKGLIELKHINHIQDRIKHDDGLVFKTGWSKYVNTEKYREDLPRISHELAIWCADNGISLIGVEPPSIADVTNIEELTKIHEIVLEAGIMIVEGLSNLESITMEKVQLVALPLKVKNADGAPARVIAIEN